MAASGSAGLDGPDEPRFEPIDFDDLHELLEGQEGKDDPVFAALELGVEETKRVAAAVDRSLEELEKESVVDYVNSFEHFEALHHEIQDTDKILEKMEKMLGTFQTDLSNISDEIRTLQGDSLQMNMKLRNRRALQSLMSEYVNSVVVSPTLVQQICEEEINESYLEYLSELNRKLEHVKQQEMQKLPSCAQSTPQLESLRTKAVSRVKDFLLQKVNTLKRPRTNLQILQQNVLVKFKFFTQFLAEHHSAVALEVQQHYVETMSAVYMKQFKTYVTSLQKLELESAPTKADMLVSSELQPAGGARRLLDNIGLGPSVNLNSRGNVFSLSGRDAILKELDKDPIIAHTHRDRARHYHEQLFRSHQMLLMDTATSEFLFLRDFFDTKGDHSLFNDVFGKTKQYFLDSLEAFLATCWDSVGLLLMIRIVDTYRKTLQRRNIHCLDSYLDEQQLMIRPRLRMVLDENVKSLRKATNPQNLPPLGNTHQTHPHLVTRRYAELAASLTALSSPECGGLNEALQQPLAMMQQEVCALCKALAAKLDPDSGQVFLVNNYDLVLTVFLERQLPRSATGRFEDLLRDQVQLFVENQLVRHFPDLVAFVRTSEPLVADPEDSTSQARSTPAQGVDVGKLEAVVRSFAQSWKRETERIHQHVINSFTNFTNGTEILKQVVMQLVLYYTRMQKVMKKCFPNRQPAFSHELVSNTTLLMEIQRYSRTF